ncbi:EAL domain-containing protein (putative c-di-GMP-specific phosphodiesterase class I) [Crenobacter luteus]|uniref:Diguanylate phosphodiesterase n=1 Tax=Crenobacter luteus TaxID=1452487 RepID=A0A161SBY3_9NEIS|nr:EAL domain-containing protein [Crenobacter luteus]KZE33573.1 diguanylate phosphodiesterase [Crenobacter luteus]TCP12990.1 EAL domain-containing protein (putative c-di-GMP-specific phosphodiesterase class I) [Crenobacter luteus]
MSSPPPTPLAEGLDRSTAVDTFFQPIYSLAHRRTVGLEALARPLHDHFPPHGDAETRHTQDVAACTQHARRFLAQPGEPRWLCLNVDTATLERPERAERLVAALQDCGVTPETVVLELLDHVGDGADELAVSIFKQAGFLIAIDNFGAQQTDLERIYRIAPDLVKFGHALVRKAGTEPRSRQFLSRLVQLMHDAGALVVVEGVETDDDVGIALESGCDLVQGFFVAPPAGRPEGDDTITPRIDAKWDELTGREMLKRKVTRRHLELSRQAFVQAAIALMQGTPFSDAATPMLALPDVLRCFLLDHEGRQIGANLNSRPAAGQPRAKFAPLADTTGAIWSRRAYFQHAIEQPGVLYMSQPYLSMTDTRSCVTLSMAIEINEALHVLCADLQMPH